jgi:ParB-like chromosome segregation protein Spo0J
LCPPELQHDFPARALKELRMSTSIKQLPLSRAAKNTLAITYVPVDQLKPDPRNARVHSKKQIRQIARSIESFGFNVPILVGANLNVIAGHGRVLAAKHLGLTEVPTIRLDHLMEVQRRAFMIADNRLTEIAVWDDRLLAEQLKELASVDLDFDIEATGFDLGEIDFRIESLSAPAERADRAADSGRLRTRRQSGR